MGIFLPTTVSAEDTAAIVERKLQWILSACHPLEVWLFGSAATGEMTEASDIDLILLFEDAVAIREAQRVLARTPSHEPPVWTAGHRIFCGTSGVSFTSNRLSAACR
jgi:hypothetical protein